MPSPRKNRDQVPLGQLPLGRLRAGHASLLALIFGAGVSIVVLGAHPPQTDPQEVREILDSIFAPLNFHVIRIRKIPARRNHEWV
ncbi:MAG: hypothetical protein COB86_06495 [Dehalococcoidia bacterium]|nr:MAG: hypothetical protein COB86_06495 [Dehalococcoidia bacterium]